MNLRFLLGICLLVVTVSWGLAQELVLDSTYYDVGIVQTEDFENVRRDYYRSYDEENRPLVVETQRLLENMTWENWRRREYTYNEDGELGQILILGWQEGSESWLSLKGRLFTYDEFGNITSRVEREATSPGENPVNTRRWEYTYEGMDMQTEVLFQRWQDGSWTNDSRQLWGYNANGLTSAQLGQQWDGMAWQDVRRRMWEYTSGIVNMVTEQVYDEDSGEWVNERRIGYQNSGSMLWNQSTEQVWDDETQGWTNVRRELISYINSGAVEKRTVQFWEDGAWLNTAQSQYQSEDDAINIIADRWNEGSGSWDRYARYQLRFNEAGLKIVEQGWQYWSMQMNSWLNAIDSDRWRYFWSEVVVSTAEPTPDADCLWPNPYQPGQTISCTSLPQTGMLTLEMVNGLGQVVHQQAVAGGASFTIDVNLPKGWYVCRIFQKGQLLHLQPTVFVP